VLLVHHAGVNGRQRGTSRREDALDTVIALRRPADYSPEEGARFQIHVEKARTLAGEGALPLGGGRAVHYPR
jgi:putative DNA primase/helicase